MRTVPTCAAICTLSLAALASADVYVFDNAVSYQEFCADMNVVTQDQSFNSFAAGSYATLTGGSGNYAWSATALSGLYANGTGLARTQATTETMVFTFSSGNVYAVGGDFFNQKPDGTVKPSTMKIRLSDGTTFVRTVSDMTTFSGFVSDGVSISSMEVSHTGTLANGTYVASSGFNVGAVPAPGAMALVGLAGFIARRRRA
jgi:MYXO-CTERM domain-containing protein